ncbi:hypothetical protein V4D09_02610 [Vibrio mimicus]|uniref:hypothetical protein n=1 Tax=Vibrio mimicus TaxID=674 RepID=UPI002F926D5D
MTIDNGIFEKHLREVIKFHFSPETGSLFWLNIRSELSFDPLNEINSLSDLKKFPDVSERLKNIDINSLIPRGINEKKNCSVFESGGTTGKPKKIVVFDQWLDELVSWRVKSLAAYSDNTSLNTLAVIPSGPHIVGEINKRRAKALGGHFFTVDMDPRWVKKLLRDNDFNMAKKYSEHLIEQIENIIYTQDIGYLIATPPLLELIAKNKNLVEKLNKSLKMITWGGTQMNPDTLDYLRKYIFPKVIFNASYGSTMILGEAQARKNCEHQGSPIFDSFSPNIVFEVKNIDNPGVSVEFGSRGRVLMHHLTKFAFLPNILERDTAIRLPRTDGFVGDAVAMIEPMSEIAGVEVIEGVY